MKTLSQRSKAGAKSMPFLTREKSLMNNENSISSEQNTHESSERDFDENKLFDDNTVITNDDL